MPDFPFVPSVFVKALLWILVIALIAMLLQVLVKGSLDRPDYVGYPVASLLAAYLVHLYMIPDDE